MIMKRLRPNEMSISKKCSSSVFERERGLSCVPVLATRHDEYEEEIHWAIALLLMTGTTLKHGQEALKEQM